jgi:hypothetical protein
VRVTSLGFRTDLTLRVLEGAEVADRGDYLVIRSSGNPDYWWGNFLLLAEVPEPGTGEAWLDRFAAEFPAARHVALGVDTASDEAVIPEEFIAAGLEVGRETVLTAAEVRPPPHPNSEAEIRPLTSDDDWRRTRAARSRSWATASHAWSRPRTVSRSRPPRRWVMPTPLPRCHSG